MLLRKAFTSTPIRANLFAGCAIGALAIAVCCIGLPRLRAEEALTLNAQQQHAKAIYKELVEINTVTATGDTGKAAEALAAHLRAAGFDAADIHVFHPAERKGNLVARLHGTGAKKPILLLAHLDVVEAKRADWTTDPFQLVEKDGYFYGRGSGDDKFMASTFIGNLIRYKQEGYKPDRDIIVALETDEEILDRNGLGVQWLLKNHRDLIDAEFALNEGGGVGLKDGKPVRNSLQTTEKVSVSFTAEVVDKGGHSSVPTKNNPIYHLAGALARLGKYQFPVRFNETTRAFFERTAALRTSETGTDLKAVISQDPAVARAAAARLSENPLYNAQLRTTCTATMLEGGHAINALPQLARAGINCRMMPGESVAEVRAAMVRVFDDDRIVLTQNAPEVLSEPSALRPDVMQAVETLTKKFWPGTPVIPVMSSGATDGSYLRNAGIPTYGHSGFAADIDDPRAHGKDERVMVKSFFEGQQYLYELVKILAGGK